MSTEQNKNNIAANRRAVFELENKVLHNRALAYAARSMISENTALIQKNYQAAFIGNRQLANQNTDDLFRNRLAIVRNIAAHNQVETNYKEALQNKVRLEFVEHRAKINERLIKASNDLSNINKQLIDVNRSIMDTNEEIATFNKKKIADNAKLLAEGVDASKATPASNAELIAANREKIAEVSRRSDANKEKIQTLYENAQRNRASIMANMEAIQGRRDRIFENHKSIASNQKKVADFISKL